MLSRDLSRGLTQTSIKLDATLPVDKADADQGGEDRRQRVPLFALVSLNSKTAPSTEVCWSQLLALSLAPEDEPVLTVGRAADLTLCLSDRRVSARHFEVVARRKAGADCEEGRLPPGAVAYECFLKDCSSNGTQVNGTVVGKGNSRLIRSGDEICVLPACNVGEEEQVSFLFRNTTEALAEPAEEAEGPGLRELEELIQCPICLQAMYKCVALTPCAHNYCMACYSDWMRRGRFDCPVCRRPIIAVMKNRPMDGVVEAFLNLCPKWRRTEDDLRDMDARDELRLGRGGKLVRDVCSITPQGGSGAVVVAHGSPTSAAGASSAVDAAPADAARAPASAPATADAGRGARRSDGSQVCAVQ